MGFFKRLFNKEKKTEVVETVIEQKEIRKMSIEEVYDELWSRVTWDIKSSEYDEILNNTSEYVLSHREDFENRGIDLEDYPKDKLQMFAFIDLLIQKGHLYEFDYNVEAEDFLYGMNQMKSFTRYPHLSLRILDDQEDIEAWIKTLNIYWSKQGYRIYEIDIDSNSYVLFVSKIKKEDLDVYNKQLPMPIIDTSASMNLVFDEDLYKKFIFDIVLSEHKRLTLKEVIELELVLEEPSFLNSKLGGIPYLDLNYNVPKTNEGMILRFFAQINLSELPNHNLSIPKEGMLQFWLLDDDIYGLDSEDGMKVIYYPVIDESVEEANIKAAYQERPLGKDHYFMFEKQYSMTFKLETEVMSRWDSVFDSQFLALWNKMFKDDALESLDELESYFEESEFDQEMNVGHKIGGYPFFTQWDPRDEDRSEYEFLLLQIDSDFTDGKDVLWGDLGVGNFFMSSEDASKGNFSKVLYNWDCH